MRFTHAILAQAILAQAGSSFTSEWAWGAEHCRYLLRVYQEALDPAEVGGLTPSWACVTSARSGSSRSICVSTRPRVASTTTTLVARGDGGRQAGKAAVGGPAGVAGQEVHGSSHGRRGAQTIVGGAVCYVAECSAAPVGDGTGQAGSTLQPEVRTNGDQDG